MGTGEKEAVFLLYTGQPRSETNRTITCPGDHRRIFDTSSDTCMSHHATRPRFEVIDSTRPNCRVYQKPSFTTNLPANKITTVIVRAFLLPKMTIAGAVALSWEKEMLSILRLHPRREGIRATVIQGCCYTRGALPCQRGYIFKIASEKEISSSRMEKRTSRELGTGGGICINTGIRGFGLGPDLVEGPWEAGGLGEPRTTRFVQTRRLSSCLKVGLVSKPKTFSIFIFLYPVPPE